MASRVRGIRFLGIALTATTAAAAAVITTTLRNKDTDADSIDFYHECVLLDGPMTAAGNVRRLRFSVPPVVAERLDGARRPVHFLLKNPDLGVCRAYTPVSWDRRSQTVDFVIKPCPTGATSRYACGLRQGARAELCGPLETVMGLGYEGCADTESHLVMIAGGTGITPFVQMLDGGRLLDRCPLSRVTLIVYASVTTAADFLLSDELERITATHSPRFTVHYLRGRPTSENLLAVLPAAPAQKNDGSIRVLVCGPDGMVSAVAGPRDAHRAFGQGVFGGLLCALGFPRSNVHKLLG